MNFMEYTIIFVSDCVEEMVLQCVYLENVCFMVLGLG